MVIWVMSIVTIHADQHKLLYVSLSLFIREHYSFTKLAIYFKVTKKYSHSIALLIQNK